jgi:hypothetical protein
MVVYHLEYLSFIATDTNIMLSEPEVGAVKSRSRYSFFMFWPLLIEDYSQVCNATEQEVIDMQCILCSYLANNPPNLVCGHPLCHYCFDSWHSQSLLNAGKKSLQQIPCPLCNTMTPTTNIKINTKLADAVASLK